MVMMLPMEVVLVLGVLIFWPRKMATISSIMLGRRYALSTMGMG